METEEYMKSTHNIKVLATIDAEQNSELKSIDRHYIL
jgi:hypothetical protein